MKIKLTQIAIIIIVPALLFGFQNCSKLGTNGIAVNEKVLSLDSVQVAEPVAVDPVNDSGNDPVTSAPNNGGGKGDNGVKEDPSTEVEVGSQPTPSTTDPAPADIPDDEVADAIRACQSETPLEVIPDLDLKFNHESVSVDVQKVTALKGNYGSSVVVRAQNEGALAESIHINNSTLILCDFAHIENIKGTQNHIIIVNGEIEDLQMNNSTVALVNAQVKSAKGPNTVIKNYSLK
ncbi:hypothetical protein [Bdellovibrio sp. BCCA]|uniref:hypothetical protein n=1 Tax=Bdellovibrio sp. BCCA TaxID=3136281 RepID=UPI0030F0F1B3